MSTVESDRDLLKLAAKAAGIEVDPANMDTPIVSIITTDGDWWNPLEDDGDALRLAVRLRITPHIDGNLTDCEGCTEAHLSDPCAATRRAIVRAAAEIGRAM